VGYGHPFVIDQITLLNETAGKNRAPFANRIDLSKVAAWGHSFGGRAAARACQLDQRIKACLNADGLGPDGPIFRYEGASLPVQPFMWMEVFHEPPTDVQLEPYKMTRKDWERDHQAQLTINDQQLRACPGGSYHVSINLPGIEHFSFTDKPLIEASKNEDAKNAIKALNVIEDYTSAFFDKHLRLAGKTLLDTSHVPPGVSVERFRKSAVEHP
jgi:predicted dienelactone hydrolase